MKKICNFVLVSLLFSAAITGAAFLFFSFVTWDLTTEKPEIWRLCFGAGSGIFLAHLLSESRANKEKHLRTEIDTQFLAKILYETNQPGNGNILSCTHKAWDDLPEEWKAIWISKANAALRAIRKWDKG